MIMLRLLYVLLILQFKNLSAENPSVIIIGAGVAGVAAATKLLENSIANVTIVEAQNRIGGRIHSVKFGDDFVDLGAEFSCGEEGNSVYELVKDLDLLKHSNKFVEESVKFYYSNGSTIAPDLAHDLHHAILTYDEGINKTSGANLGDALLEKYTSTIIKKYSHDQDKLKVATEAIKLIHDEVLINKGTFSWKQAAAGKHFTACSGDRRMTWKNGGYHSILKVLMKNLPINDILLLNKKVTKIIWNVQKVTVVSSDNSSLTADHVIFTPSVGVLHHDKDTLFEPLLPPQKKTALEAIGFNGVIKITLRFSKKWWNDKNEAFYFLWNEEDLLGIKNEFPYDGPNKTGISWVPQIPEVLTVPNNPNVLVARVVGDLVPEVEKLSKDTMLLGCMYVIRRFLGKDYNVSNAEDLITSQWNTNPNFRGTYSHEKAKYFEEDISYNAKLAEPLANDEGKPVLLFAGEATSSTRYASVHGAIDSGRREAERIINLYGKK